MSALLGGLAGGLAGLASLPAILLLITGTVAGIVFGVIPGLGGIVLLVVLLPFLYNMPPLLGLALLLAAHSAIYYAASTTSILMNTPGAPEQAATCLDGYPMTQKGQAARALGISAVATTLGGWLGALALLAAIPLMLFLVTLFHPPEYLFLTILAVVLIGQLQARSTTKGVISGVLGFMFAFMGDAPSTGTTRFTFGSLSLYNGFAIAIIAVGLFAISEMLVLYGSKSELALSENTMVGGRWGEVAQGMRDVLQHKWLVLRSAGIGVLCGVIPGIGSTAANFISYGQAMRSSKNPELFGSGIPEGIVAPEASSISKEAGALIPTVALGIPNGPAMAVLLSAFAILGLVPGPSMLTAHLSLVFSMVWVLAISALLGSAIGLSFAPTLAKISTIPGRVLVPFIFAVTIVGAYATTSDMVQTFALIGFGVVGLILRRYGYSLPALIVGVVLGKIAENNMILTAQLYGWSFVKSPLTDAIILMIAFLIISGMRSSRKGLAATGKKAEKPEAAPPVPRQELLLDVIWVVVSGVYVVLSTRFVPPSNLAPMVIGLLCFAAGCVQLAGALIPKWRLATHGVAGKSAMDMGGSAQAKQQDEAAEKAAERESSGGLMKERRGQWVGFLLACGLMAGIYVFGFTLGTAVFMFLYFRYIQRSGWLMTLTSTAGMSLVTYLILFQVLHALPPPGLVFQALGLA